MKLGQVSTFGIRVAGMGTGKKLTRQERQEFNRRLLLEAAEKLFAERGVEQVTLDEIADEVGLTKGAVYSNFKGKGDLIAAVLTYRQYQDESGKEVRSVASNAHRDEGASLDKWIGAWQSAAGSVERKTFARLIFELIPFALRDEQLGEQFRAMLQSDPESVQLPFAPHTGIGQFPKRIQSRILSALDLGLALQILFDEDPEIMETYDAALRALSGQLDDPSQ